MSVEAKRDALNTVMEAARIHSQMMTESLSNYGMQPSFRELRRKYIRTLEDAISEARTIKLDSEGEIMQRVSGLDLEQATDLRHAVEDHIRNLRQNKRSEFS